MAARLMCERMRLIGVTLGGLRLRPFPPPDRAHHTEPSFILRGLTRSAGVPYRYVKGAQHQQHHKGGAPCTVAQMSRGTATVKGAHLNTSIWSGTSAGDSNLRTHRKLPSSSSIGITSSNASIPMNPCGKQLYTSQYFLPSLGG